MSESIRTPSVWSLPWHTLRLAGRCILPLVMWYSAGELVRFGLLVAATEVSHGSMRDLRLALTMLLFIVVVMAFLLVNVGMFYSLRGSLSEIRARRADGQEDERFVDVLNRVIVPFVALYLAWGWHVDDVRDFLTTDVERQSGELGALGAFGNAFGGPTPDTATGLTDLSLTTTAAIMVAAFLGRFACTFWQERRAGRLAAVALAFCELGFFYYGVQVVASRGDWLEDRLAMVWWHDLMADLALSVPGWKAFTEAVATVWPYAWDALVLPAVWLTVAILMYGAYAEDARAVISGTRLENRATEAEQVFAARTHSLTRRTLTRLFGRWAHWVALANTVRLAVRGGAPLFGLFALCFVAIRVGEGYAMRGVAYLVGTDHPLTYWNVILQFAELGTDFAATVLIVCLLAATFDVAASAGRRGRAAPAEQAVTGRSAEPLPRRPAPAARSATLPTRPARPVPSGPPRAG
ncbi:hypothetical protein [Sphaerisporangium sp. TRM90804]|uniref:hypothetical protein n=1 Tax=Sphaerisporangium sp. TRM90804 TaxID=3031113 RepID=UPI00244B6B1F|nr:hypothetical protein [Sphaerisporangium sp. TRM90804]MDH2426957.1 hypothetical protein [Sphaerisporangium sp. TRM90804]